MDSLNLADTFITFFALFGPQKVLLPNSGLVAGPRSSVSGPS